MAEESYPFVGQQVATELQWSRMARLWAPDGVALASESDPALKVTANGTSTVTVEPGLAWVNGFAYRNSAVKPLAVPTNVGNASARTDLVVLRCSQTADSVVATYRTGGVSAPPLAADHDDVYDLPLAQLTVGAGSTVVASSAVADRRWGIGLGQTFGTHSPAAYARLRYAGGRLDISDGSDWTPVVLGGQPRCRVWQTGSGDVLATSVPKDLAFNVNTHDNANMHTTTGDPAYRKVFAPVAGVYEIAAGVGFDDLHTAGWRSLIIVKRGTIPAGGAGTAGAGIARTVVPAAATGETTIQCAGEVTLAVGDWVSARATQNSGGNLGVIATSDRTFLTMKWVRDA